MAEAEERSAAQPEQQSAAERDESAPQSSRGIRFGGQKVLIVDDDIRNVFALTSVLEQHGLSVLYAETGARASRCWSSTRTWRSS